MLGALTRRTIAISALVASIVAVSAASARAATPPAQGTLRLTVPDAFLVGGHLVTVPGRAVHIHGVVSPYVPGQTVLVKASVGGKPFKTDHLRVRLAPGGKAGQVTVRVGHKRNAALGGLLATRSFAALDERAGFGSRGAFVELIQQRLAALHFWIPQTGVYDSGTGLAIDAYHRLLHWGTYQT